jgi:hypothetical protein
LVEPIVFQLMKDEKEAHLKETKDFLETLQILLISYHNMGMVNYKQENLKYAAKVFEQGWKLAKKFFGPESNFAMKFKRKLNKVGHPNSK